MNLAAVLVLPLEAHYVSLAPTTVQDLEARNTAPADFHAEDDEDYDCEEGVYDDDDDEDAVDPNRNDRTVVNAAADGSASGRGPNDAGGPGSYSGQGSGDNNQGGDNQRPQSGEAGLAGTEL
jgi:hypothetical protein